MRFVRALLDPITGEPRGIIESEIPIAGDTAINDAAGNTVTLPTFDLGLFYDFDALDLDGKPVSAAVAIHARIEKHPAADTHADAPKVRIRPDVTDLPASVFCPTTEADLANHLRANGLTRLPAIAQAWLVRALPADKVSFLGLDASVNPAMLRALESNRRGTVDGGLTKYFEKKTQEQSDVRSAKALATRQRIEALAAASAWAEIQAAGAALIAAEPPPTEAT